MALRIHRKNTVTLLHFDVNLATTASLPRSRTDRNGGLLEDHLEGAVVEGVSAHHPHDLLLHHGLVGSPGEGRPKGLDARQHPEGLGGGNREGAVWTWRAGWGTAVRGTAGSKAAVRSSPLTGPNTSTNTTQRAETVLLLKLF